MTGAGPPSLPGPVRGVYAAGNLMTSPTTRPRRRLRLSTREALWAYAFLLVPLAFFLLLRLWPALQSFRLSFFTWHVDPDQRVFVGLRFYRQMAAEIAAGGDLYKALRNMLQYFVIVVPGQMAIGLFVAVLLNSVRRFKAVFRAIYFAPYVTPAAAVAWVWGWMYSVNFGVFNNVLFAWSEFVTRLGLPFLAVDPQPFLTSPQQALPAVAAVVIWQQLGFQVVIFLAGLQGVPREVHEAAEIDGANAWQRFWYVTFPLLNPVIVFSLVISTIATLQLFDQVVNINFTDQGGPLGSTLTIALYMYQQAFQRFQIGYAAAVTVLLFFIIMVVTVLQLRLTQRRVEL